MVSPPELGLRHPEASSAGGHDTQAVHSHHGRGADEDQREPDAGAEL